MERTNITKNKNSTTYVSLISVSVNKHIVSNFRLPDNLEIFNAKNLKMQIPTPLEFSLYVLTEAEKVGGENLNPHWSSFSVLIPGVVPFHISKNKFCYMLSKCTLMFCSSHIFVFWFLVTLVA